jgi:dihydrofolate synthase/folylpolyglutamate synthase
MLERGLMRIEPGRVQKLQSYLELLGSPHLHLPPVVHVAGTNGKGSTVAFIRSILEAAGLRVHAYTSPHFERFNERIVLAGSEIDDRYLHSILEECRLVAEQHNVPLTFFEGTTVAALLAFSRIPADVVVLEVGLGGVFDATNVVPNPAVTVITPISFDHMRILGNSIAEIALNKAGIIKQNVPCVVSMQLPDALKVIEYYANAHDAEIIRFEHEFGVSIAAGGLLHYQSHGMDIEVGPLALAGYHQYINAATAIAAVEQLKQFQITAEQINLGVSTAKWRGRLEKVTSRLLPDGWEVWLDGAHNKAAAQAVSAWLRDQPKMETYLIFGMTHNRDANRFLSFFKGLVSKVVCVGIKSEPSAYKADALLELIDDKDIAESAEYVEDAIRLIADEQKGRVLIIGSLFLLADFYCASHSPRG